MTKPIATELDQVRCRTPQCQKPAVTAGVCNACYQTAQVLCLDGETTVEELVELGLVLPLGAKSGFFLAALEAARAKQAGKNKDGEEAGVR